MAHGNTRLIAMGVSAWLAVGCSRGVQDSSQAPESAALPDVVELDSAQLRSASIQVGVAELVPADTLGLTGTFTYEPARVSHVGPRMKGRIRTVRVAVGSRVNSGDTLVVLDSPELGAAQATWFQASVGQDVARRNWERIQRLFGEGIVSERRRLEAEAEFRKRESHLAAARRALAALGAQPDSAASGLFVLRSPLAGEIVEKHATAGEVVGPQSQLFTVANMRVLWMILDVYESDLSRVRVGAPVFLTTEAYPDRVFSGRTAYIASIVDEHSRTVKVRVVIPNSGGELKPGMFARARLVLVDETPPLGVPADAVQTIEGRPAVFLPESGGRDFRVRPVTLGRRRAGSWVEVLKGLAAGDSVVTHGSFELKSELLKESFSEDE